MSTYLNAEAAKAKKARSQHLKDQEFLAQTMKELYASGAGDAAGNEGETQTLEDEETSSMVHGTKKQEAREKQKLIKQFDAFAAQFDESSKVIKN